MSITEYNHYHQTGRTDPWHESVFIAMIKNLVKNHRTHTYLKHMYVRMYKQIYIHTYTHTHTHTCTP